LGFSRSTIDLRHQKDEFLSATKKRNSVVEHKEGFSLSNFFFNKNGDYSLNDLIMIKLSTFENMEELNELPELITNQGLKDIDNLYIRLGYKKPGSPMSMSPVKYKIKPKIKAKVSNGLQEGPGLEKFRRYNRPITANVQKKKNLMPVDKDLPKMKANK
jgi:hypothetical protein